MSDSVCAVVVTYNRKDLLIECLEALKKQTRPIQGIYLIDNASTDGTPGLLLEKGYISELPPQNLKEPWEKEFIIQNLTNMDDIKLHYVRMHENTGGAGGFYEGVKRGYEKGYDWLWLMDDDVEPNEDCLYELLYSLKEFLNFSTPPVLVPLRIYNNKIVKIETKKLDFNNLFNFFTYDNIDERDISKSFFSISAMAFEGPLIHSRIISQVGFPNPNFFIFADDTDYSIRIVKKSKIFMIPSAILTKKLLTNDENITWKTYYLLRNIIWLDRQYGNNFLVKFLRPFITFLRFIKKYFLDLNLTSLKYLLLAFKDGYIGKMGCRIKP